MADKTGKVTKAIRISVTHARANFGKLLDRAEKGEIIGIERDRKLVAVLMSFETLSGISPKAVRKLLEEAAKVALDV